MHPEDFIQKIRDLIAQNELNQALKELRFVFDNSPHMDELLLQSARFNDIRKQIRLGVVDFKDAQITQNQIRKGLLELLDEIEQRAADDRQGSSLRAELKSAAAVLEDLEQMEQQGIRTQAELMLKKLNRIRQALALETEPDRQFKYETQIEQIEAELAELKNKLS